MNKADILQALRLVAMGRTGHPLQDELAGKLAEVFASTLVERVVPGVPVAFPFAPPPESVSQLKDGAAAHADAMAAVHEFVAANDPTFAPTDKPKKKKAR